MLRVVDEGDPIKQLFVAYMEARQTDPAFAESLRQALKQARQRLPRSRRPYDLQRRLSRALARFRSVRDVQGSGRSGKIVPLPARKVVRIHPDSPLKIGA